MKDTDYLTISARIRARENSLLTRERRERMVEARDDEEAAKVLSECGYAQPEDLSVPAVNAVLSQYRESLFRELRKSVPEPRLVEVFQIKYDYHNAKALLKSEALGENASRLLMAGGRYTPDTLSEDFHRGALAEYTEPFRDAVAQAQKALFEDHDPQKCDLLLDRACYAEMADAAKASGSALLPGYVRLCVDAVNLRAAVRLGRMGRSELLEESLLPGGDVSTTAIAAAQGEALAKLFDRSPLEKAAKLGVAVMAPDTGSLTEFERSCDNALVGYLAQAKRIPFGEQPVVGYLCAREAEATAIRTILSGRKAGLSAEAIRERLRDCYV